jgi:hypothetical protein
MFPRRNWDPPASVPLPPELEGGGGGQTHLWVRGWGSNSDDWKKSLALCLLCGFTHTPVPAHFSLQISPRPEEKNERENVWLGGGEKKEQIEQLTDKRDTKNKGKKELNCEKGEIHGLNNYIYIK